MVGYDTKGLSSLNNASQKTRQSKTANGMPRLGGILSRIEPTAAQNFSRFIS